MRKTLLVAAVLAAIFSCKRISGQVSETSAALGDGDPMLARQQAIERARSAGILGSRALTATADVSSGFDSTDISAPLFGADRKQVHTAQVQLVVVAYDPARAKLDALVASVGGTVESTNVERRQDAVSDATIVLRLPPDAIAKLLPRLRELGEISAEATTTTDVTSDYGDTTARLVAAKTLEKRLLQLAASPNGKIEDVLAVERELARVRGEIEGFEQKIRHWDGQVATSALTIQLTTKKPEIPAPPPPPPPSHTLGDRISDDFNASISSMRDAGEWLASNGIALLPWLVITFPGLLLLRRLARRVRIPWAIARTAKVAAPGMTTPVMTAPGMSAPVEPENGAASS